MSAEFLLKTAAVLEAAAEVLDAQEAKTREAVKVARDSAFKSLMTQYAQRTGEELPEEVASKLAASDEATLAVVTQVLTKTAGAVESLGRSSEQTEERRPTTKKEAADSAWKRFGNFINS